jgi:hypothetical protein
VENKMSLTSIINKVRLNIKRSKNKPDSFEFVSKDENGNYIIPEGYTSVKEVGTTQEVTYPMTHDVEYVAEFLTECKLTDLKYGKNLPINAVCVVEIKEKNKNPIGKMYVQPLKLEK